MNYDAITPIKNQENHPPSNNKKQHNIHVNIEPAFCGAPYYLRETLIYSKPFGLSLSNPLIYFFFPFDKALLSNAEGLRANGIVQRFLSAATA